MGDTASFHVRDVHYGNGLSHTGVTAPHERTGVTQAEVTCVGCGHAWTATAGQTGLRNMLGGVRLECPNCEALGNVRTQAFG